MRLYGGAASLLRFLYGASNSTNAWLGTTRTPGQLVLFCSDTLVRRVAGMPFPFSA